MKKFLTRWSQYYIYAGLFSFFINILFLTFPVYMLSIYDRVLSSYSVPTLITISAAAALALAVQGLLDFIRSRLLVKAGVDIDKSLSKIVFGEMQKDSCSLQKSGYASGLRDVNVLRNYLGGNAVFALFDLPWTPIYLLVIYLVHPLMGLVATGGALLSLALGISQELLTRKRLGLANQINNNATTFTSLCLRNSETLAAMGMVSATQDKWQTMNGHVITLQTEASNYAGGLQSLSKTVRASMQVIIYGVGAYLALINECTPGVMIASSIIMGRALAPIDQAMATWKQTLEARASYKSLSHIVDKAAAGKTMDLPDPTGRLDVEGASLQVNGKFVLRNIVFSLSPGETLGLIGPSAAGKSTLGRLILGIWPSMGGKVRLDGFDLYQWDQEHLGKFIGYLPQDVELFPGTVSENIARLGNPDPEMVITAARKAGVHELITHLPDGYDTNLGLPGQALSGGQRQRIALARALYGNPKLVLLDEPNSNLDDAGEKALLQTINTLKQEKVTTIVITHKPLILSGADKILLLQHGQVARFGPRQEVFNALFGNPPQPPPAQLQSTNQVTAMRNEARN